MATAFLYFKLVVINERTMMLLVVVVLWPDVSHFGPTRPLKMHTSIPVRQPAIQRLYQRIQGFDKSAVLLQ